MRNEIFHENILWNFRKFVSHCGNALFFNLRKLQNMSNFRMLTIYKLSCVNRCSQSSIIFVNYQIITHGHNSNKLAIVFTINFLELCCTGKWIDIIKKLQHATLSFEGSTTLDNGLAYRISDLSSQDEGQNIVQIVRSVWKPTIFLSKVQF